MNRSQVAIVAYFAFALMFASADGLLRAQVITFRRPVGVSGPQAIAMDATGVYLLGHQSLQKVTRNGEAIWICEFPAEFGWIAALAVANGSVYVSGIIGGNQGDVGSGFLRKYDSDGREVWTRQGPANSFIRVLAADDTGAYAVISLGDGERSLLQKYQPNGIEVWSRSIEARFSGAATDGSGIYLSGRDVAGAFLRKYDSGGTELWSRPIEEEAAAMAADVTGVYHVIGKTLRKHNSIGVELWTRDVSDLGVLGLSLSGLRSMALDATGVYVAGSTTRTLSGQCSDGGIDAFVRKYGSDGTEQWTRQFGTRVEDYGSGIAVDSTGIYVALSSVTWAYVGTIAANAYLVKLGPAPQSTNEVVPRIWWECVLNAASFEGGGISPGEIVTVFGEALGPVEPTKAGLTPDGRLTTDVAQTRVLFNGVPAPLLYVSDKQINAIVPYSLNPFLVTEAEVQVEYRGVRSDAVTVPLLTARPGFFLAPEADQDPFSLLKRALIFNEDGTVNSKRNPARRGSIITVYLTGEGAIRPSVPDGTILHTVLPQPLQRVVVEFGDEQEVEPVAADVLYVGGVYGAAAGLLQVNVRVPSQYVLIWESTWMSVRIGSERASTFVALRE